jgi:xylulose-5-phosphate/fructose-6-phosphate phosphoketolase
MHADMQGLVPSRYHRLIYRRANHGNLHVHGFKEKGSTTMPFDTTVRNKLNRFSLARDVIDRVPGLEHRTAYLRHMVKEIHVDHREYVQEHGDEMPLVKDWTW